LLWLEAGNHIRHVLSASGFFSGLLRSTLTLTLTRSKAVNSVPGKFLQLMPQGIENTELYGTDVTTGIGVLHEPRPSGAVDHRHEELSPGKHTVLDYGLRWGPEAMFSDFKSRGFGLMQSQIERPERLERLILIMAMATYWAVSAGVFSEAQDAIREQKNTAKAAAIPVFIVQTGPAISPPPPDRLG
jgi:hypothetical protein